MVVWQTLSLVTLIGERATERGRGEVERSCWLHFIVIIIIIHNEHLTSLSFVFSFLLLLLLMLLLLCQNSFVLPGSSSVCHRRLTGIRMRIKIKMLLSQQIRVEGRTNFFSILFLAKVAIFIILRKIKQEGANFDQR